MNTDLQEREHEEMEALFGGISPLQQVRFGVAEARRNIYPEESCQILLDKLKEYKEELMAKETGIRERMKRGELSPQKALEELGQDAQGGMNAPLVKWIKTTGAERYSQAKANNPTT